MIDKVKSVLVTHIAKRHFLISLLWLRMKESMQVKPYRCNVCEMTLKMKSILKTHIAKRLFLIFLVWLFMKECMLVKTLSVVFVKWHLRWKQFLEHTLKKGISSFLYFDFLSQFFPSIWVKEQRTREEERLFYCLDQF